MLDASMYIAQETTLLQHTSSLKNTNYPPTGKAQAPGKYLHQGKPSLTWDEQWQCVSVISLMFTHRVSQGFIRCHPNIVFSTA